MTQTRNDGPSIIEVPSAKPTMSSNTFSTVMASLSSSQGVSISPLAVTFISSFFYSFKLFGTTGSSSFGNDGCQVSRSSIGLAAAFPASAVSFVAFYSFLRVAGIMLFIHSTAFGVLSAVVVGLENEFFWTAVADIAGSVAYTIG